MNFIFPANIFTRVLNSCLSENLQKSISHIPSSQVTKSIENNDSSVGLIPAMDLLKHKDLFVSAKFGISFEGSLCNSYLYFSSSEKSVTKLELAGDISSQEVILSKILFNEIYGSDIEIELVTDLQKAAGKNLLIAGDENFTNGRFQNGFSFAESIIDTFSVPYVNYVFASVKEENIKELEKNLKGVENTIYNKFEELSKAEGISADLSSFIIKFDEQDLEGVEQILRLPYYHGIIKDIVEVKFC